jgi:hypothetical protein
MASPAAPSVDRRISALLDGRARDGYLSRKNRLGVIVDDCDFNVRAYNRSLVPTAARLGIGVERFDIDCITGYGDAGPSSAAMQSAVLRFRTAGVDRVMFLSNFENVILFFAQQAEAAQYYPGYLISSHGVVASQAANYPRGQLTNMHGTGWSPVLDVTSRAVGNPAQTRCRAALASQGVRPASKADDFVVDLSCESFFLLESVLKASRGVMDASVFRSALTGLGSSYRGAATLGQTSFTARKHDGPDTFSAFDYRAACSCFQYSGRPFELP